MEYLCIFMFQAKLFQFMQSFQNNSQRFSYGEKCRHSCKTSKIIPKGLVGLIGRTDKHLYFSFQSQKQFLQPRKKSVNSNVDNTTHELNSHKQTSDN